MMTTQRTLQELIDSKLVSAERMPFDFVLTDDGENFVLTEGAPGIAFCIGEGHENRWYEIYSNDEMNNDGNGATVADLRRLNLLDLLAEPDRDEDDDYGDSLSLADFRNDIQNELRGEASSCGTELHEKVAGAMADRIVDQDYGDATDWIRFADERVNSTDKLFAVKAGELEAATEWCESKDNSYEILTPDEAKEIFTAVIFERLEDDDVSRNPAGDIIGGYWNDQ